MDYFFLFVLLSGSSNVYWNDTELIPVMLRTLSYIIWRINIPSIKESLRYLNMHVSCVLFLHAWDNIDITRPVTIPAYFAVKRR